MKSSELDQYQNDLVHSVETPAIRSPANGPELKKTLLVVDDDPLVRNFEVRFLSREGYTVLQADSAAEALRLAGEIATINLLITDLLMPEVDGIELTRRFRAVHPKTPVLIVSDSLFLFRERSDVDLDRFELLEKPFHLSELLHKVQSLLDGDTPP